eukprot:985907-Amphidinium_carterae.3
MKRVCDGFEKHDYLEETKKRRQQVQQGGEEVEGCENATTLLQRFLSMILHYAPDFFKTLTMQKRDDLKAQQWTEAQVQQHEQELQATKLLELYTVLPQKALD